MDWLNLLDRMEEYYLWRRDKHPPYPDFLLEWALFSHLRGQLRLEAGAAPDFAEVAAALADLRDRKESFEDLLVWEQWLEAQGGIEGQGETPEPAALVAAFTANLDLGDDAEMESLLADIAPLDALPAVLRRAATCPAYQRLFATMAEFFTPRDEPHAGRRLFALASLCGGRPARHWLYRARWTRRSGDPGATAAVLESGLERFPDDIELIRALAEERDRQGDLAGAVALLERAVERRPEWPDLRYDLARLLDECEHPEESLLHIGKALALNPGYTRAAITRAEVLMGIGELEEAEAQLLELSQRHVSSHRIYELLSQIYAERGDERAEQFSVLAHELKAAETSVAGGS